MLTIRLQRVGRKNDPSFRLVLTDSRRAPKSGGFLEILGSYDARKGNPQFKRDRIEHWLSYGVKPSATVHNLLVGASIIQGKKIRVSPFPKQKAPDSEAVIPALVDEPVPDSIPVDVQA